SEAADRATSTSLAHRRSARGDGGGALEREGDRRGAVTAVIHPACSTWGGGGPARPGLRDGRGGRGSVAVPGARDPSRRPRRSGRRSLAPGTASRPSLRAPGAPRGGAL